MMTEYLSTQELFQLTGFARVSKQQSWLEVNGIPHRVDGARTIVSRLHVKDWLEGKRVSFGDIHMELVK